MVAAAAPGAVSAEGGLGGIGATARPGTPTTSLFLFGFSDVGRAVGPLGGKWATAELGAKRTVHCLGGKSALEGIEGGLSHATFCAASVKFGARIGVVGGAPIRGTNGGPTCVAELGGSRGGAWLALSRSTFVGCWGSTQPSKPGGVPISPVSGGPRAATKVAASIAARVVAAVWATDVSAADREAQSKKKASGAAGPLAAAPIAKGLPKPA